MNSQNLNDLKTSSSKPSARKRGLHPRSFGIGVAVAAMGFAVWAQADTPSSISSTTFSRGTTISSSAVNTNFSNLYDSVNGLLQSIFVKSEDGNVGIGTTTPAQKLSVAGTVESTTGGFKFPDGTTQTSAATTTTTTGSSVWTASASDAYFNSGNVGIGTTSPLTKVHIEVNTPPSLLVNNTLSSGQNIGYMGNYIEVRQTESSGNIAQLLMGIDGNGFAAVATGHALIGTHSNHDLALYTNQVERMRLTKTGNIGIGTTTPLGKLDVNGAIYQRGSSLHADYVFEKDYKLESIKEHKEFMWKNKHLPAIPKAQKDKNGLEVVEVGSHRKGIVEELEKAHIYISQLESNQEKQAASLAVLQKQVEALLKGVR